MPPIDTNLASKLKQATSKPMYFAYVAKGSEGKLIVDRKKISAKEIADTRKEIGGGTIFKGRCVGEDGKLVFEITKEPPGTLAAQLKKVIKTGAGLNLNVDIRVNASAESEEAEAEAEQPSAEQTPPPAPPAPGASASGGAKAIKRLNELSAAIKAAIAGPDGARVKKLFGSLNDLLKKKDFEQVEKVLDELEALVRGTSAR